MLWSIIIDPGTQGLVKKKMGNAVRVTITT